MENHYGHCTSRGDLSDSVSMDLIENLPARANRVHRGRRDARVVPVAYLVREGRFVFCTIPSSDKVPALQRDPRVAITIDVAQPPCCLLLRGHAKVEIVDGVPDDYLEASHRNLSADQHEDFDAQVRELYDSMARIVITPNWVRLNDFHRTLPRAVERIVASKS